MARPTQIERIVILITALDSAADPQDNIGAAASDRRPKTACPRDIGINDKLITALDHDFFCAGVGADKGHDTIPLSKSGPRLC